MRTVFVVTRILKETTDFNYPCVRSQRNYLRNGEEWVGFYTCDQYFDRDTAKHEAGKYIAKIQADYDWQVKEYDLPAYDCSDEVRVVEVERNP